MRQQSEETEIQKTTYIRMRLKQVYSYSTIIYLLIFILCYSIFYISLDRD